MKTLFYRPCIALVKSLLLITAIPLFGQTITWEKNLGGSGHDYAYFIRQTNEGGYIIAGNTYSTDGDVGGNNGNSDYWIVKLNQNGEIAWEKSIGGSDFESARYIQQTVDGGYIICGVSLSNDGDVGGNNGSYDYWVVKLDVGGEITWEKNYGGSSGDFAWSIRQTTDEGYVVFGHSDSIDGDVSSNNGGSDYWVVKIDSLGEIIWDKNLGGSGVELGRYIKQTTDAGYILAGFSTSNDGDVSGNNGGFDYWVVKLNSGGEIIWEKNLGGSGNEIGWTVEEVIGGGYIVCGYSNSNDGDVGGNNGNNDYWVVRLDEEGEIIWEKNYGGSENEYAISIQQTMEGGFILAGDSESNGTGDVGHNYGAVDYWIIKIDPSGEIEWEKNFGGSGDDGFWGVQQTMDEEYIIVGYSESNDGDVGGNNGMADYWILKIAPPTSSLITSNNLMTFDVHPNPSSGVFYIQTDQFESPPLGIYIYDLIGNMVYSKSDNFHQLNLSEIPAGVYTININCKTLTYTSSLIISR